MEKLKLTAKVRPGFLEATSSASRVTAMNFWHNAICDILHLLPTEVPLAQWIIVAETEDGAPIELELEFQLSEVEARFTVDQLKDLSLILQKPVMGGIRVSPQIFRSSPQPIT